MTPGAESDEWMTLREAAVRTGRSYGQVLRLMESGTLTSRRTESGRYFVLRRDVERVYRDAGIVANEAGP